MQNVNDIKKLFIEKYKNQDYITDKSGVKTIELIGETYIADQDVIFGNLNKDYAERELMWYKTLSLNVNDIPGDVPKIWQMVASKDGFINSNYGWCIWSYSNFNQYEHVVNELLKNKNSRRAIMIYTRPSIWHEYNKLGMQDFICTNSVQVFIRNDKLIYIVNQRSCDAVFGYKNDMYWHRYIQDKLVNELKEHYPNLKKGDIVHQVGSLHIYERHFKFIQ